MNARRAIDDRFTFRGGVVMLIVGAVVLLALGAYAIRQDGIDDGQNADSADATAEISDLEDQVDSYADALLESNTKLERKGGDPVVPEEPVEDPESVLPQAGPRGPAGTNGTDGRDGTDGRNGIGAPGDDGTDGTDGEDGAPGADGADGADGAQGPAGPEGPQGPPGTDGTATPGTYSCPSGQYVAGFTVQPGGAVTLDCQDVPSGLLQSAY